MGSVRMRGATGSASSRRRGASRGSERRSEAREAPLPLKAAVLRLAGKRRRETGRSARGGTRQLVRRTRLARRRTETEIATEIETETVRVGRIAIISIEIEAEARHGEGDCVGMPADCYMLKLFAEMTFIQQHDLDCKTACY